MRKLSKYMFSLITYFLEDLIQYVIIFTLVEPFYFSFAFI